MSKEGKRKQVWGPMFYIQVKLLRPQMCVYGWRDRNGGMPARACVIGRFAYEDKYRVEPSFVIATFMRKWGRIVCASSEC